MKFPLLFPVALSVALVGGCKASPVAMPNVGMGDVTVAQNSLGLQVVPQLISAVPHDGMATLRATMRVHEAPKLGFSVQYAPPSVTLSTFTKAVLTLYSGSAFTNYNANVHTSEVEVADFSDNTDASKTAEFLFPPLRPANDYEATLFLKNAVPMGPVRYHVATVATEEHLAGSHKQSPIVLQAGENDLDFDVTVNGDEFAFAVTTSETGNKIDDSNITKDDVVTLATGVAADQPGVTAVKIFLLGACYGNGTTPVLVANLTDAASWNSYTWDTTAATEGFVPDDFQGGADLDTLGGKIIVQAFNANNELVGTAGFEIGVFGRPTVNVTIR